MSETDSLIVAVEDLVFAYDGQDEPALDSISFSIRQGEIFGFLGPNGAGKSTTQKILMRLLNHDQGTVRVLGRGLDEWGSDYYERIGVSFELPNHYQKLTALENLELFRSLYSGPTMEPMELLRMVGLEADARRRVSQFSKGMQSRLTFVRSLLCRPDLVFLDEPTSGLDPVNARIVRDIIRDLKHQGRTVFLTTHDMRTADELCDRVAFLSRGKIALVDTPRNLKLQRGRRTLHMEYRCSGEPMQADFDLTSLGADREFLRIIGSCAVETMHSQEASLDDIFREVTGEQLQ
jgi:fluoroquinolone transport system ATP-binding protein